MATCVPWELDASCCEDWVDVDPIVAEWATELAWSTLRTLTAGAVGACPVTVRPCLQPPCDHCAAVWMRPMLVNGQWINQVCGSPKCSCEPLCEIVFGGPVARVDEVLLDGIALDPALFRVDDTNRLVRQDGQCWPSCQRLDCALGEVCTLGVTYVPGYAPGAAGLHAAGVLACEFAKACSGGKCRLPSSVTTLARQGVVMTMSGAMFPGGMTGIREVDAYLSIVNPFAAKAPPAVWSPDVPWEGHRYTTWTAPAPTP